MENATYLPLVHPDVGYSLAQEVDKCDDEQYLDEHLARLENENPTISTWIKHFAKRTDDELGSMWCAMMVYRLLESQAEVNRMMEEIRLD